MKYYSDHRDVVHKNGKGPLGHMKCGADINPHHWNEFSVPMQAVDAGYPLCPECFPDSDFHPQSDNSGKEEL